MTDFLARAHRIAPELAETLQSVAEKPFQFSGENPNEHSYWNHEHLYPFGPAAALYPDVTQAFRVEAAAYIFGRWTVRLRGYAPYRTQGYRLYLYEEFAPTVSVVAETAEGFPYGGKPQHVQTPDEIMMMYGDVRRWNFADLRPLGKPDPLLAAIERAGGSIGTTAANRLGISVAQLRRLVEWHGIEAQVNAIRKRHGRRPAGFQDEERIPYRYRIYERLLPPGY